jgi:hypothetical protein
LYVYSPYPKRKGKQNTASIAEEQTEEPVASTSHIEVPLSPLTPLSEQDVESEEEQEFKSFIEQEFEPELELHQEEPLIELPVETEIEVEINQEIEIMPEDMRKPVKQHQSLIKKSQKT